MSYDWKFWIANTLGCVCIVLARMNEATPIYWWVFTVYGAGWLAVSLSLLWRRWHVPVKEEA